MEWFSTTFFWYFVVMVIGLIFIPITRTLFHNFTNEGYAFSKVIGIVAVSYSIFVLSTIKLVPFTFVSLVIILACWLWINYHFFHKKNHKPIPWKGYIAIELAFFAIFLAWAYVRSHEPSVRTLEKFMDYGFMNSVLRSTYLPAQDIWLAGSHINYYYFGHIVGAVLTKLSHIPPQYAYNLILATICALGVTLTYSLASSIGYFGFKNVKKAVATGILAAFLVNFGGNLHTIYSLTNGYPNEKPSPIWELEAKYSFEDLKNLPAAVNKLPENYWYPNATRFIPFTIHEFPLYSYVVADLHGHVYDIPFVLLTMAVIFMLFMSKGSSPHSQKKQLMISVLLGFCISINYMTNAFDGPIYIALAGFVLTMTNGISKRLFMNVGAIIVSFIVFNLPFTLNFEPFASQIGVNCPPQFLANMGSFGPFLFDPANCQRTPFYMLWILWGFLWFNFIFFAIKEVALHKSNLPRASAFLLVVFSFGTLIILASEFIYAKDIYPNHFRANTMFKLGYQAFIMMGIATAYTFVSYKDYFLKKKALLSIIYLVLFIPQFAMVATYPSFAIDSYYGHQTKLPSLDGSYWIEERYPEYGDIITYFQNNVKGQPTILEAQGDSYTDYNVVSAYTGLPTVAGWAVHEWLWRGSYDIIGGVIPDVITIYESQNIEQTRALLQKHNVEYVIIGSNEKTKYPNLYEDKFEALGQSIFTSRNGAGKIYKITLDTQ